MILELLWSILVSNWIIWGPFGFEMTYLDWSVTYQSSRAQCAGPLNWTLQFWSILQIVNTILPWLHRAQLWSVCQDLCLCFCMCVCLCLCMCVCLCLCMCVCLCVVILNYYFVDEALRWMRSTKPTYLLPQGNKNNGRLMWVWVYLQTQKMKMAPKMNTTPKMRIIQKIKMKIFCVIIFPSMGYYIQPL